MNKLGLLTITFFIAFTFGEKKELSLKDCIQIGLTNGQDAKILQHGYQADHWSYQAYRAGLSPQIILNGIIPELDRSIARVSQDDGSYEFYMQSRSSSNINLTLSQNIIATGGNIFASSNISREDEFGDTHTYNWRASPLVLGYTQPLFQYNHLKGSKNVESLKMTIAKKQYVENKENLAVMITSSFFDLYISEQLLRNSEFNVTVNDTIYRISQGRYSVGKIAENELLQSELAVMNSQNNYHRNKLNYERNYEKFKSLIGFYEKDEFIIILPEKLENFNIEPETAIALAKRNGSSLISWQVQKLESEQAVQIAKKNQWLSADMTARVGYNQTAQNVGDLYKKPLDSEFFSIGFEIPITRSKNEMDLLAAEENKAKTDISAELFETEFEQNIKYQVKEFQLLEAQLKVAIISDSIAVQQFKVAKERYLIGKTDVTTLFLAQNGLDATHRQYYQTLKDYWVAYYQLRKMTLFDFENKTVIE